MRAAVKRGFSLAVIGSMLAQGPALAVPPERIQQRSEQGLCRKPAPLPMLGGEQFQDQQQGGWRPRPEPMPTVGTMESGEIVTTARSSAAVDSPEAPPPPPPPAPPPPPGEDAAAAVAVGTGETTAVAAPAAKAELRRADGEMGRIMPPYPPPYPHPRPQAGLLTAGEHDDLLNPELYADYVRRSQLGQQVPDLPRLDTQKVLTVAVHDTAGRPVPFAQVELACADGSRLRLATTADGTVTFFPELDHLGRDVWIRTPGEEWRAVAIPTRRGAQRVDFTIDRAAPQVRKLDLMLVIDTTGSMGDEIRYLQTELASIVGALKARHSGIDMRVGFVFYRDIGDDYVTQTVPLGRDIALAQNELRQRWAGGGGDYPEAVDRALIRANAADWRPDAVKSLLLVADAPPHDDKIGLAWSAAENLRAKRVQIVPVAASGVAAKAEYVMRAMAAATQSRYTFLTDDSGIGSPHAAPAIDCYLVTRLDALLRRVIDSQISGRRIEPDESEVIRSVGQYDKGRCVIPRHYGQGQRQEGLQDQ